LAVNGTLMLLL